MTNTNELTAKLRHWASMASVTNERVSCLSVEQLTEVAEALEAAEKRIAELATECGLLRSRFKLEREILEDADIDLSALRQRIAELEARTLTVKLPKPHAHLIWIQAGHAPDDYWDDVAVSHSDSDRCCDGSERYPVYARWEIEEMLAAAGIKLQIEGE